MMDIVDEQVSRERMRVADGDRERVAGQLQAAHAEGRLDLAEFDERVRQAWAARTYGDLDRLTSDLPSEPVPAVPGVPAGDDGAAGGGRAMVATWLGVSVINLLIWAVISLATLNWIYPWWVWVAGPWGALLLTNWILQRVGGSRLCG